MYLLVQVTDGIWTCGADLLVHSPVKLTDELKTHIDALGTVKYVVAPNKWHHLFVTDFKAAYPTAQFFCAPGLERKRKDFVFDRVIRDGESYPWAGALYCDRLGFAHLRRGRRSTSAISRHSKIAWSRFCSGISNGFC